MPKRTKARRSTTEQNTVTAVGDGTIPAALKRLGVRTGFDPPEFLQTRRFGRAAAKTGMTTLFSEQPHTLWLSFEKSVRSCGLHPTSTYVVPGQAEGKAGEDPYVVTLRIIDALKGLVKTRRCPYQHVVFDTVDRLQDIARQYLNDYWLPSRNRKDKYSDVTEYGQGKMGWYVLGRHTIVPFRMVENAGLGWTALSHSRILPSDDEDAPDKEVSAVLTAVDRALSSDAELVFKLKSSWTEEVETLRIKGKVSRRGTNKFIRGVKWLTLEKEDDERGEHVGCRIPMPESFDIPLEGGYDTVKQVYEEACEAERQRFERRIAELTEDT